MLPYYQENEARMNWLAPTVGVLPALQAALRQLKRRYVWVVITEGWAATRPSSCSSWRPRPRPVAATLIRATSSRC